MEIVDRGRVLLPIVIADAARVEQLDPAGRMAVLVAATQAMVERRERFGADGQGALLYRLATELSSKPRRLELSSEAVCALLHVSRHECGHGDDVTAPLELARLVALQTGYRQPIGEAVRDYADALFGGSVKATLVKRRAALFAVLEPAPISVLPARSWMHQMRARLARLTGAERRGWEHLILTIKVSEVMTMSWPWAKAATPVLAELGHEHVHRRLTAWWPAPTYAEASRPTVELGTSGGQLVKHFIWLLTLTDHPQKLELAERLLHVDWRPHEPQTVLRPAAALLATATA